MTRLSCSSSCRRRTREAASQRPRSPTWRTRSSTSGAHAMLHDAPAQVACRSHCVSMAYRSAGCHQRPTHATFCCSCPEPCQPPPATTPHPCSLLGACYRGAAHWASHASPLHTHPHHHVVCTGQAAAAAGIVTTHTSTHHPHTQLTPPPPPAPLTGPRATLCPGRRETWRHRCASCARRTAPLRASETS